MEIGSEYWEYYGNLSQNNEQFWNLGKDNKFVLSGRTAIYYVLENILAKRKIKKVYFPSYSCKSMLQAFEDLEIQVLYYDVYYDNGLKYNINLNQDCDIFFAMNYFGYSESNMENYTKYFKEKGCVIIEDITHSILSEKKFSKYSDYLIASLRKWFPIFSGGLAVSVNEKFLLDLSKNTNDEMITKKRQAMENKSKYINNIKNSEYKINPKIIKNENDDEKIKKEFLNQYFESGKKLEENYKNYSIDKKSLKILMGIDLQEIINTRERNVKLIYNKFRKNDNIKFLFKNFRKGDCLLFVPIILENNIRNSLRKYLINNNVYLPVHWPQEYKINEIADNELSLICDQRYNVNEINYYLDLIEEYFKIC